MSKRTARIKCSDGLDCSYGRSRCGCATEDSGAGRRQQFSVMQVTGCSQDIDLAEGEGWLGNLDSNQD